MRIRKAIIATAGYGTRRLPITKTIEKNMLPVGNRPVIDYVVEECVLAGITEIYLVVNNAKDGQIKQYYSENAPLAQFLKDRKADEKLAKLSTVPEGVTLHFVEQDVNKWYGTSIPVTLVAEKIGMDEPLVFCNGDDPFWGAKDGSDIKTLVDGCRDGEAALMGYKVAREDMPRYGMIIKDKDNMMTELVEKPALTEVTSTLANINRFLLSPELIRMIVEYTRGHSFKPTDQEYLITDPIFKFIRDGGRMRVVSSTGEWLDCGSVEGWLHANNTVLGN